MNGPHPPEPPVSNPGPLAGLRALELGGIGPGPFCGMLLADLGVDVVKVERVDVADTPADDSARYEVLNRGRTSVAVDLRTSEGRDIALSLVETCDMVFEGFRPGVAERLGVGPAECMARNPRVVYGRMTGWGQRGPLAQTAGHDINYIALTGVLDAIGTAGGPPVPPLNLLGDFGGGGVFLALGLVSAVWESARSGHGQVVDASIVDGTSALLGMLMGMRSAGDWTGSRGENLLDGGAHFYGVYQCADGHFISVGAIEPQFYERFLDGLGVEDVPADDRMEPTDWPALRELAAEAFRGRTRAEWMTVFAELDACVAPVLTLDEAAAHPHNQARAYITSVDGVMQPGQAPRFDRTSGKGARRVPRPGEHTDDVLRRLGIDDAGIKALRATGVVAGPR
ncbi:MAG: CoA transferase [Propionibacteriales bacterium]|nr:CoA transferase [Propionibacteriales bacterium]